VSSKSFIPKPTVLTLALPEVESESKTGTLLVQRGDLARVHQFTYECVADLTEVIADALIAFAAVEADPPVITEVSPEPPTPKKSAKPTPSEPTVDVPLKKGTKAVKISYIKITGGETDAAAYRQAVLLAGKLIDGKLWDGETPIQFDDVYRVAKKMKFLTAADFSLFKLEDFVETGDPNTAASELPPVESAPDVLL
jgi:hypothetical protein